MTLIEELRQAAHYTALDPHRDLLERAAADVERKTEALRIFTGRAFPVSKEINQQGYAWCEPYLDQALPIARAALSTQGEKT